MDKSLVRHSRFLSLVLRHRPEAIGITLDENGWVDVETLLEGCRRHGRRIDRPMLDEIVRTNNKRRFALSPDGKRIRASQGHSIEVDLGLEPVRPPDTLFHGTATRFLESILAGGLEKRSRRHVHLSPDVETAIKVGARHGKPVVLAVAAGNMHENGYKFYLSANGVWLTESVPREFLEIVKS